MPVPTSKAESHVLIIGAGLAGLALAQGLQTNSISFAVYERDSGASFRPQGYRIKTFEQTDVDLRYLLRPHIMQEFLDTCAETVMGESTCNAINGIVQASRRAWKPRPWTVEREVLRNVLLLDLDEKVHFGYEFTHYEISSSSSNNKSGVFITAYFADGSTATGTLLIGADGTHSRVRRQHIPSHRAIDTQGVCLYGKTAFSPQLMEQFPAHALRWITTFRDETPLLSHIMTGQNDVVTLFAESMRFPNRGASTSDLVTTNGTSNGTNHIETKQPRTPLTDDYVYWALLLRQRRIPSWKGALVGEKAKELSLDITAEWDPSVRSLLELQDTSRTAAVHVYSTDPALPPWEPSACVTVLGDAVRAMPPSGAVGAVAALHDASTLARRLVEDGVGVESIGAYEKEMRAHAGAGIGRSLKAGEQLWNQPPFEECKEVSL